MDSKKAKITDEHRLEAKKLRAIWDEKKPSTQEVFGETYEIGNQAAVGNFLAGRSALSLKAAVGFAHGLGCRIDDFSPRLAAEAGKIALSQAPITQIRKVTSHYGRAADRPPEGYIRLEHLSPRPSMGAGALINEPIQIVQHLDVLEQWVRQEVGATNPARIKVLTGNGNSMAPTINDKDLVFVDIECRSIETAGIYVLDVAGRFILKKAMILSNGTLIIRSDNTAEYPDEERHDLSRVGDSIVVCGKVLAWWTLRKG
ncbi:helix-turn-helix transcriptional regulator [Alcaligenaceae bacterium]|nr:helix-turn-helix transcriptional regulator [Alcaligenaceae bacterium]